VLAAVEDLLFRSKISETASQLGVEASFPRNPRKLLDAVHESPPDLLILDLNSARFEPLSATTSWPAAPSRRTCPRYWRAAPPIP
jgi:CheY-like chemotaxis protein